MQKTFPHRNVNVIALSGMGLEACYKPEVSIDVDSRDRDRRTPLHCAAEKRQVMALKLLIKYQVTVNAKDKDGETLLLMTIVRNNTEMI